MNELVAFSDMFSHTNPNYASQIALADYHSSLEEAIKTGIKFGEKITIGNWEFIIVKGRKDTDKYPIIKHSLFTGAKRK